MDPDSKRRISRSLGSLDDILVTLERLKQGPGFSRATAEVEVTNGTAPGGGEGEGEDGEESRESEAAGTERSRSREEGGGGDAEQRGSRGKVLQQKIPSSPKTPSATLLVETRGARESINFVALPRPICIRPPSHARRAASAPVANCDKRKDRLKLIKQTQTASTTFDCGSERVSRCLVAHA